MRIAFIVPGKLDQPTGGYQYDKNIIACWRNNGVLVKVISLPGQYPLPDRHDRQHAIQICEELGEFDHVVVDGLAGGGSPKMLELLSLKAPVVSLIHHPLCLENGLSSRKQQLLERTEREGLAFTRGAITTSRATAATVVERFGLDPKSVKVAEPGVNRGSVAEPWKTGPVRLICVASLTERKGHRFLVEALAQLKGLDWKLDCYGSEQYDAKLSNCLKQQVSHYGLEDHICFHGAIAPMQLEQAYTKAHIFVLPSLYEGYGMVLAEAIVRGLPIISTTAGAIPQTVPGNCGMLVEPGSSNALARAIRSLVSDHDLRQQYRDATMSAASAFPDWQQSADMFLTHLKELS